MDIDQIMQTARTHHQAGRVPEAEALYRQVLKQQPDHAEALHLLGMVAYQCGAIDPAIHMMSRSLQIAGEKFQFLLNFGEVLRGAKRWPEAISAYHRALRCIPANPEALYGLAIATEKSGDVPQAKTILREIIAAAPNFHRAYMSLGALLEHDGKYEESAKLYERAIGIKPDYARARVSRAHIQLRNGLLAEAWADYEWRWRVERFPGRRPDPSKPIWDGSHLAGRTLLLYTEQGLGDAIQFARYLPFAARSGGRVLVQCHRSLMRLLAEIPGVAEVRDIALPPPSYDVQLPLLSAPGVFGTTLDTIPRQVPYLSAPRAVAAAWADRFSSAVRPLVGLCWSGGSSQVGRSLKFEQLQPLAQANGVTFVSLQMGASSSAPSGMQLVNPMLDVKDFADTAAIIEQLDLVISIDTSVAHLAGALGKPTWTMLKAASDWRWLLDRTDSPWYPTMRLFRQSRAGNWGSVIADVAQELKQFPR